MSTNPILPGFNPDPSITEAHGTYYLVTSTFEYLPGLPVYSSRDLESWTQIGNVATRPEQLQISQAPTNAGVYAPTIRFHDGLFYVIVTLVAAPRATVLFTAEDPAGPWSDGLDLHGFRGIDPDLAWDTDGTALVTYSGLTSSTTHHGIQQVTVDLTTGQALEEPRSLWSGTGNAFPEAPHLYQRGAEWYLLIAEGGTERGHAISVARGPSPRGPFEGCPANPVLTARGTTRPVQGTGHGDLVETPDGTRIVHLGTRPVGSMYKFSPLGRETFLTIVDWVDGWPRPRPTELSPGPAVVEWLDLSLPDVLADPGWLGVRALPTAHATTCQGGLQLTANGSTLADLQPCFVGRRQQHLRAVLRTEVEPRDGSGGLAVRYDEWHWFSLEAECVGGVTTVTAHARVPGLSQSWSTTFDTAAVALTVDLAPPPVGVYPDSLNGDVVRLMASDGAREVVLAQLDGKLWSAELCSSFTGRVMGLFATRGQPLFRTWDYRGCDAEHQPADVAACPVHGVET